MSDIVEIDADVSGGRDQLTRDLKEEARRLGFDLVGVAPAVRPDGVDALRHWLASDYCGEMQYMPRREEAYSHPDHVLPAVRSLVIVGLNYFTQDQDRPIDQAIPRIARYARGSVDYHDLLRGRLKQLAAFLHERRRGCRTRGVIDTAPLLERDFAQRAGLGWFGKNTMLINRQVGSWLFLAALLTDVELTPDESHHSSHCGTCTRCLDACPTDAFVEPYVLDARRCISYLTIELRDQPIPLELREGMGDWIFGCDVCQDVCPWNRKAPQTEVAELIPVSTPDMATLLAMSEQDFQARFRKTPLDRPGHSGVVRNAAIAAGNSGDVAFIPALQKCAASEDSLISDAARWGLEKLRQSGTQAVVSAEQPVT